MSLPPDEPKEPGIQDEVLYAPCDFCPDITQTAFICTQCERRFCAKHASTVDSNKCLQCVPFGPGHIENITEYVSPLIDKNNHPHRGRRIVPTGEGYKTLPRAISEMSDNELEDFITSTALKVHEAERQRDYLKVSLSTANLEKDEREKEALAALKGYKIPKSLGIKITGGAGLNGGKLKGVAGSNAGSGIDIKEFLKFVAASKKTGIVPPASLSPAMKQTAPLSGGVSNAPGVLGGTPVVLPSAGPEKTSDEIREEIAHKAREAEIEAILAGGEPQSNEMKELLKPIPQIKDEDIPF